MILRAAQGDAAILLGCLALGAFLLAVRAYDAKFPAHKYTSLRVFCFVTGVAVMASALAPPFDDLADRSFAVHMTQHLALTLVGPPLVLLGAPVLLFVALPASRTARAIARVTHHVAVQGLLSPAIAWVLFAATLWSVHFTPLYNLALQYEWVHLLEHALFVVTAFLFWMPVVQVGYAPRPTAFPARLIYLFLAIPQGAFLGLALYESPHVLYAHYLIGHTFAQALLDQQNGGAVMWIGGGILLLVAFLLTVTVWASRERQEIVA